MPTIKARTWKQKAARDIKTIPKRQMERTRIGARRHLNIPLYIQMCVSLHYLKEYMAATDKPNFIRELRQ